MKTAISIPDPLFAAAERFAQNKGLSRSELYAQAIQAYLQKYHAQDVLEALNQVYETDPNPLNTSLSAAQTQTIAKDEW